ncbi:non-specific lipid-transfer protein 2-like [Sesamum indicum]|uniref:Non-specific lipid-transfer protein 2-like n=1 Tax=Sesamum indicum TaxID=4182 RepID=A0A6I9UH41_SESIN|nr:non-specific lipid-transfer protein 2-like [Sesamum indicum]
MKLLGSSLAVWCVVVVLWAEVPVAAARLCSLEELSVCMEAVTGSEPPTSACCSKLAEQEPCLCEYLKVDPNLKQYVNSPAVQKVAAACNIHIPTREICDSTYSQEFALVPDWILG